METWRALVIFTQGFTVRVSLLHSAKTSIELESAIGID